MLEVAGIKNRAGDSCFQMLGDYTNASLLKQRVINYTTRGPVLHKSCSGPHLKFNSDLQSIWSTRYIYHLAFLRGLAPIRHRFSICRNLLAVLSPKESQGAASTLSSRRAAEERRKAIVAGYVPMYSIQQMIFATKRVSWPLLLRHPLPLGCR